MKIIGDSLHQLEWMEPGDGLVVSLDSLNGVDLKSYGYRFTPLNQKYLVFAKPRFYVQYVRECFKKAASQGVVDKIEVLCFSEEDGAIMSQRSMLYIECKNHGFNGKISYVGPDVDRLGYFVMEANNESKPPRLNPAWMTNMKEGETREFELKNMKFSEFRSRVYSTAKRKGIKLSVSWLEANKVSVTHKGKRSDAPESFHAKFNAFLDTIKPGDEVTPPEEFLRGAGKDAYIRVLVTKHRNPLKYRGGKVVYPTAPTTPRATIDDHGNFILDGKNLGPRDQRYIDLKLRPLGIKLNTGAAQ